MEFLFGEIHAGTGTYKTLPVLSVSSLCVIVILRLDGAPTTCFITTIADVRGVFYLPACFSFKTRADKIASQTGSAVSVADLDLIACIDLFAPEAMYTEVVWVYEAATMISIYNAVIPDLFGNGGWILAKVLCNLPERLAFVQSLFDINTILKCQMCMVTRYHS